MFSFFSKNKKATERLYERSIELAVKNKTLLLLEKLYQTSVLNLTPEEVAKEITEIIRKDLNLELAGVLVVKKETDSLEPLAFSESERLLKTLKKLGFLFDSISIKNASRRNFFSQAIHSQKPGTTDNPEEIWKDLIKPEHFQEIKKESHIKTALVYPLMNGQEVFGVLLLGFNRDYETLNAFEKASIASFTNVIALLINKAYLYKGLQDSYEVTKKAYALEKKAKEELESLDKVKDQFLMTTQHNLRTPLTSMMGYSDLLLNGTFGKQNKKTVEVIKKFQILSQGMIKMVNDFLDMAQFQLGKSVITLKPDVELEPILNEIVTELQFKADSKGLYLKMEKPEKIFKLQADREKIKAALFNIVDNAIKYTVKGGVEITVKNHDTVYPVKSASQDEAVSSKTGQFDRVKITVADTGIGIPKEKQEKIFSQMFERGEEAKKVAAIGSGVGLYLSGQIIKSHNGKVWVTSEGDGRGSTFHVELPLSQ